MNPKYFLISLSIIIFGGASAQAFGEILRNADGTIKVMTHFDAMKACPTGTHLPTIREFSIESQANGAKGILELSQVNPDLVPAGYYKITAINPDGQKDEFYFNHEGYIRPGGDLSSNWFWSSSYFIFSFNDYYFMGGIGAVDMYYSGTYSTAAVLCAPNQ